MDAKNGHSTVASSRNSAFHSQCIDGIQASALLPHARRQESGFPMPERSVTVEIGKRYGYFQIHSGSRYERDYFRFPRSASVEVQCKLASQPVETEAHLWPPRSRKAFGASSDISLDEAAS